jgi:hypothetical protein
MDAYTIEIEKNMKKLEKIGLRYGGIEKSIKPGASQKGIRATLITKASQTAEGSVIADRILKLQRQRSMAAAYGLPISKEHFTAENGPAEMRTDDELLAALEEITRELKRRGYTEEEAEDDWSSAFEEA